jgi:aminoacylase
VKRKAVSFSKLDLLILETLVGSLNVMASDTAAIENFQEYLRIRSVQPNPDYDGAIAFLKKMAEQLDLAYTAQEFVEKKPIVVMTWLGTDPALPAVLLNSHTDVVPVFPEFWKHDPFGAIIDDNGDIYARGTQDMKSVGMQYIEAIRRLKADGFKPLRTIHLSFVPDEEIGGADGMENLVKTSFFKSLNIGFALDEGLANPTEEFMVYYGERSNWWIQICCNGHPGHGSLFIEDNAGEKLRQVLNSLFEFS